MPPEHDPFVRIQHALDASQAIFERLKGLTFEEYMSGDDLIRTYVERKFEIVGEALAHIRDEEPELTSRVPDLKKAVAVRNRVIHGYDSVDHEVLWEIVSQSLPVLCEQLSALTLE